MPNRPIHEVIRHRKLVTVSPETSVAEAAQQMKKANIGAVLVLENDTMVGIFTERDCLYRVAAKNKKADDVLVGKVMTKHPAHVHADRPFRDALYMMMDGGYRHVPVLDGDTPVGIVSPRDMLGTELTEFESDENKRDYIEQIL